METKWLEDFISLADTRSFSQSARLRHVTQSAFSRRIQALEAWIGAELVDRPSQPARLTPAGHTLYVQAQEMLQTMQRTRAMVRGQTSATQEVIEFAAPHTLAFTFIPSLLSSLRDTCGQIKSRLIALNVQDAVLCLTEGNCDLLIAYHHEAHPIQLDANRYEMLPLGRELLAPYVKPTSEGAPTYALPCSANHRHPYLAYAPGTYLGHVVNHMITQCNALLPLDRVHETDMAESLKAMVLEGHGIAFLPASTVRNEVADRKLVSTGGGLETSLEIQLYRERPIARKTKASAERLWNNLCQRREISTRMLPSTEN